jgi:hypothetical protein
MSQAPKHPSTQAPKHPSTQTPKHPNTQAPKYRLIDNHTTRYDVHIPAQGSQSRCYACSLWGAADIKTAAMKTCKQSNETINVGGGDLA